MFTQIWPPKHWVVQAPQAVFVLRVLHATPQQTWPIGQQVPLHAFSPVPQAPQSVPCALHRPLSHLTGAGTWHWPVALQVETAVLKPPEHVGLPQGVPLPLFPLSLQTSAPVEHDVVPVLHGFVG